MYDLTIIGAGVSSVFLAYTLLQKNEDLSVHVIDKGKKLNERICGLDEGNSCTCSDGCSKYMGFAGLGKSEGKFNYTNDFGGELAQKIGEEETLQLMKEVDHILCTFGADQVDTYSTKNGPLTERAAQHSLHVLSTEVRHLGTTVAREVFQQMYEKMKDKITFTFEANVERIQKNDSFRIQTNKGNFTSDQVVLATGMSGSQWLKGQTSALGLHPGETRLDLGIRVEMRGDQLDPILQDTFETKLQYVGKDYSATTYCMNPRGRIIRKHQHGLVMPDGQNQYEKETPSANLNFTLFVPKYFPTYEEAMKKAEQIIGGINGDRDRIVVQRLRDLKNNQISNNRNCHSIIPSLDAEKGNINEEVPELYIRALLDFFEALEGLLGESIDPDTLLYGIDAKFYEPKLYTNEKFETEVRGLYLIGDCSGETHSLAQAAASGIYLGSKLCSYN
ncbi:NAD(FAD)-utilizing dehydrogenase [Halobacillus andaensis]|uniref:NAD(FAD)-utilizing dehydrogenase n=1 Tax=Halobacillus andaensis TaxID=1176239 RepID=A0A917B118_HALAA|nr:NAD(FAD)-utilizing dehydrogenase [Halobacillus andaensis]MBP2003854.1 putative FAD-dependent dehydrogenase [Halobacillus andaensis]GGF13764.1 NAD(FAD)-utilizing dehydrogenase [Halobacillus andaensis]